MKIHQLKRLFSAFIILSCNVVFSQLVINEFSASNSSVVKDNKSEFDDWIELFNPGTNPLELDRYTISDDPDKPMKWRLPSFVKIQPSGFILLWADGQTDQGQMHLPFKLDQSGEWLGLFDGSDWIDSLSFGHQRTDISMGRWPDGSGQWYYFTEPTPGGKNDRAALRIAEMPAFSAESGFYRGSLILSMMPDAFGDTIRYTLDCSEPDRQSAVYEKPVNLTKTTVIRARAYGRQALPSGIVTRIFIINEQVHLGVLSLITDPVNLWSESGIYSNPRQKTWERPVSVSLIQNGQCQFTEEAGLQIHGLSSRSYEKKSFQIHFKSDYGNEALQCQLFPDQKELSEFKRLVVHSGAKDMPASDESSRWSLIRNSTAHHLCRKLNGNYLANRLVALYLNGKPWGIYTLMEKIDECFIDENYHETDVDLIEKTCYGDEVAAGDIIQWEKMLKFVKDGIFSKNETVEQLETYLDLKEYTDYYLLEIFCSNIDWPLNNQFIFRPRRDGGLWRWILWDVDRSFGFRDVNTNTLQYVLGANRVEYDLKYNHYSSSLLPIKLMGNADYRDYFINRCSDLLNTLFLPESVSPLIDSLAGAIRKDIRFETLKWAALKNDPVRGWERNIDYLHDFVNQRNRIVRDHISWYFNLSGRCTISLESNDPKGGGIRLNTIRIQDSRWSGVYYKGVPVELEAMPDFGYRFDHWEGASVSEEPILRYTPASDSKWTAVFKKEENLLPVVINEINYHSHDDFDTKDWVEIHNPNSRTVSISNWILKDEENTHLFKFPEGLEIPANGFLVLCQKVEAFNAYHPEAGDVIGDFPFGLGNGGDQLRLFDRRGVLIDSVAFDDDEPWFAEPDGGGYSLSLIDPLLDNSLPQSWRPGLMHGTPGMANAKPVLTVDPDTLLFSEYIGKTVAPVQYLKVGDRTGPWMKWEAELSPDPGWISLVQSGNHAGDSLGMAVNGQVLSEGQHRASVQISDPAALPPVVQVPVVLTRIGVPDIRVEPDSICFGSVPDKVTALQAIIMIGNQGSGILNWSCVSRCPWLDVTDTSGTGADTVTVTFNLAGLTPGLHSDSLLICQEGLFPDTIAIPVIIKRLEPISPLVPGSAALDPSWVCQSYSDTLTAGGGVPPYRWLIDPSILPYGISLVDSLGILQGIPESEGNYRLEVQVLDSQVPPDTANISMIFIVQVHPLVPVAASLDTGRVNQFYCDTLTAGGGIPPYRWTIDQDSLPPGISLVDSSGVLQGIPESEGNYRLVAQVLDSRVPPDTADIRLMLIVQKNPDTGIPGIAKPNRTWLHPNYPNPFNATTAITYDITEATRVTIEIFDVLGRKIDTLYDGIRQPGRYRIDMCCSNEMDSKFQSGLYFCVMHAGGYCQKQKMMLLK